MAEALTSVTSSLPGAMQGLLSKGQGLVDSLLPPETRSKILAWISKFAAEKPQLASFIASHIAISGVPLGLFITMTISVAVFAILVALILALLGSVLFIVFCVGVALVFLLPTLFMTTAIATFFWVWGMAAYYILKYFNEKSIPGIHVPLKEGLENEASGFADRGEKEGYGQDLLSTPDSRGKDEGEKNRKQIEEGSTHQQGGKAPPKLNKKAPAGSGSDAKSSAKDNPDKALKHRPSADSAVNA